uniref:Uncharacterized protein n=2 Tax=Caenorhabditis japonica TaxID=281687 RepID=A0A8R1EJQ6_CAEJA
MSEDAPFKCDYHACEMPVLVFSSGSALGSQFLIPKPREKPYKITVVCISVTFTISLAIQFFVIISLACHQRKSQQRGDYSSTAKQLIGVKRRLISAFFVFLIMAMFEVTSAIILLQNVVNIANRSASLCEMFESSGSRLEFVVFSAVLTLLWACGLFLDPIFTIVFDPAFSKKFSQRVSTTVKRIFVKSSCDETL